MRTLFDIDAQLVTNGFKPTGQDNCLNHIYRHEDGRQYTVGRSFWGGYEAIATQGGK